MEEQIDLLIIAGRRVLASDFDKSDFDKWREEVTKCLAMLSQSGCNGRSCKPKNRNK